MKPFERLPEWRKRLLRFICSPIASLFKRYYVELFGLWEDLGLHITPNHFYSPIPDTRFLKRSMPHPWDLSQAGFSPERQLAFFHDLANSVSQEWEQLTRTSRIEETGFFWGNGLFDAMDALVAFAMVRRFKPRLIIEVGSGQSTRLLSYAASLNGSTSIHCIDPFMDPDIKGLPCVEEVMEKPVEHVDLDYFVSRLSTNDMLFIDSSHVVRSQNDCLFIYLNILPALDNDVIVHVHDVFFPLDYPLNWLIEEKRFWQEQYILHALLLNNNRFTPLLSLSYLGYHYPEALKGSIKLPVDLEQRLEEAFRRMFPGIQWWGGGSFWAKITRGKGTCETI